MDASGIRVACRGRFAKEEGCIHPGWVPAEEKRSVLQRSRDCGGSWTQKPLGRPDGDAGMAPGLFSLFRCVVTPAGQVKTHFPEAGSLDHLEQRLDPVLDEMDPGPSQRGFGHDPFEHHRLAHMLFETQDPLPGDLNAFCLEQLPGEAFLLGGEDENRM